MNNQNFLSEFEKRCDLFRDSYHYMDPIALKEREELIGFAKAAAMLSIVTQPEACQAINGLRPKIFSAARKIQ